MKPGLGSAEGRPWRIRVRASVGLRAGFWLRRKAIRRVAERDRPFALERLVCGREKREEVKKEDGVIVQKHSGVFSEQRNENHTIEDEKRPHRWSVLKQIELQPLITCNVPVSVTKLMMRIQLKARFIFSCHQPLSFFHYGNSRRKKKEKNHIDSTVRTRGTAPKSAISSRIIL